MMEQPKHISPSNAAVVFGMIGVKNDERRGGKVSLKTFKQHVFEDLANDDIAMVSRISLTIFTCCITLKKNLELLLSIHHAMCTFDEIFETVN